MIDIQTDPIDIFQPKKLPETNISNITVFNSKYRIYFEIPTPASPNGYSYNKSLSQSNGTSAVNVAHLYRDYMYLHKYPGIKSM